MQQQHGRFSGAAAGRRDLQNGERRIPPCDGRQPMLASDYFRTMGLH
jgi:hypothetical protein